MGGGWLRDDSGQVIHIHVPLSPSSIVVPAQGRWYSVEKPTGPGAYHRIYDWSPAGWLPKTRISSWTLVSNKWISYLYLCPASTAGDSNDCKQTNRTRVIARTRALVRQRPTRPIEQIVCYCAYAIIACHRYYFWRGHYPGCWHISPHVQLVLMLVAFVKHNECVML